MASGNWHEIMAQRAKEHAKYREILLKALEKRGFNSFFQQHRQELINSNFPRIPATPNIEQLSLPTVLALLDVLRIQGDVS